MFLDIATTVRRLAPVRLPGALLVLTFGCTTVAVPVATGEWVTDQVKPLQDRLARLEANATAEKNRLDTLSTRVGEMGNQLTQVRAIATEGRDTANRALQTANAATQKADQGLAKADAVDGRLTRALANRYKRNQVQQFGVTFDTGKSVLSTAARESLQGIVEVLADNPRTPPMWWAIRTAWGRPTTTWN